MGFQELNSAIKNGDIPQGINPSPQLNGEVYTGLNNEGVYTTQAGCPASESLINIDKIGGSFSLRCNNLLQDGNCGKSWDGGEGFTKCKVLDILQELKQAA